MRVPVTLSEAFSKQHQGSGFEELIARVVQQQKLIQDPSDMESVRFLARSVIPHIQKLSSTFNRVEKDQDAGLDKYWKESSNPANLRLAYFLYFMPSNLFRIASVWAELNRLGYRWAAKGTLNALELGAGPASGATGLAAGERYVSCGLPTSGTWALIEQDKSMLRLGEQWAQEFFPFSGFSDWSVRPFHRTLDFSKPEGVLPPKAPKFNLWVMSFILNEADLPADQLADTLLDTWEKHLSDEGMVIICEPALRLQSRRLLELRKALITRAKEKGKDWFQILLPCLGHQACGALADDEDWCHEEVTWWRPSYFRTIDRMAGLDRKTLPFSYLVITRSRRPREEILPALQGASSLQRLVSPAHKEGQDAEFFLCGETGKRRARYRPQDDEEMGRGDILIEPEIRGDVNSSRIERIKRKV